MTAELSPGVQAGHVSLPNGLRLDYPDERGHRLVTGAAPSELTASEDRDWFAGTPWHKHIPARVEAGLPPKDLRPAVCGPHRGPDRRPSERREETRA